MNQLKITRPTFFKLDPTRQASDLLPSAKVAIEAGTVFNLHSHIWRGDHLKVALVDTLLNGKNTWYVFGGHAQLLNDKGEPAKPDRIQLSVPYRTQLDNDTCYHGEGWRQCQITAVAMWLDYITNGKLSKQAIVGGFCEPEAAYGHALNSFGDTTDGEAHTACLKAKYGTNSTIRTDMDKEAIVEQLAKGIPVPLGVAWKSGGHWVLCVGYDKRGLFIHDPYGVRTGQSSYAVGADGSFNHYDWDFLNLVFWDQGQGTGWGRVLV